ncbi:hypothetical protein [Streptomyces sp. NBC_00211]|uniref:hypothetical protein n=1 Tax=Streptomyces sp. NBC_00211 TaxID=2975683 RepID=UPI0032520041
MTRWGGWVAVPVGVDLPEPYVELSYVDAVRGCRTRATTPSAAGPCDSPVRGRGRGPAASPVAGERHLSGWYGAATTGQHVGFESWLERDRLLLMDFDPRVTGIASQPF